MSKDMTSPDVDVFISNYILVDPDVFQMWVDGYSSSDAVTVLNKRGVTSQMEASLDLLTSDVLDHFRTYSLLERLLHNPTKLSEQLAFQIDPQTRQFLIEKYYEFDDAVIRELLGKKLSSRHRKDLDEVADKTEVLLKSCRRQFDNLKRVFKVVEEMSGSIVQNIRTHFLLPEELASLVCVRLRPQLLERTLAELDTNFRSYSRALVGLACNMHRTRELRLLFIELVERCLEPWRCANWSYSDLRNFLATYTQCSLEMDVLREIEVKRAWERYMNVITVCALRMYHTYLQSS